MFGSNFDANFGIPAFPVQGMDPQGGLFGATAPDQGGAAMPGIPTSANPTTTLPSMAGPPAAATPPAAPALGAGSPLGAGALAPGAPAPTPAPDQAMGQAPAAGVGSPFGKPGV